MPRSRQPAIADPSQSLGLSVFSRVDPRDTVSFERGTGCSVTIKVVDARGRFRQLMNVRPGDEADLVIAATDLSHRLGRVVTVDEVRARAAAIARPTACRPGTLEKLVVMRDRAERGEPLFHVGDCSVAPSKMDRLSHSRAAAPPPALPDLMREPEIRWF